MSASGLSEALRLAAVLVVRAHAHDGRAAVGVCVWLFVCLVCEFALAVGVVAVSGCLSVQ